MNVKVHKLTIGLLLDGESSSPFEKACFEQLEKKTTLSRVFWFTRAQWSQIKDYHLDVIICFGAPEELDLPPNCQADIYCFSFGDFENCRNFGLREVAFGRSLQAVSFLKWEGSIQGPARVVRQARIKTHAQSLNVHRQNVLAAVCAWPASVLNDVSASRAHTVSISSPRFGQRATRMLAWMLLPFRVGWVGVCSIAARMGRALTYQKWNIGVIHAPIQCLLEPGYVPKIEWLTAPQWPMSIADPFALKVRGRSYVMVELFDFKTDLGEISALEVSSDGKFLETFQSLKFPFHMSYPCLVEHEGDIFCLPEALGIAGLTIYKAVRFPNIWVPQAHILTEGAFSDPTLFRFENRWWVLATSFDSASQGNSTLLGWWADELSGPWTPHAQNPIKMDVTSSRSAGTPFVHQGRLYRPAQNCSKHYGGTVVLNLIKSLTPHSFEEIKVQEIFPDQNYPDGFHHVSQFGELTFVDGRRDFFFPLAAFVKISRFFRKWKIARRPVYPIESAPRPALDVKLEVVHSGLPGSAFSNKLD